MVGSKLVWLSYLQSEISFVDLEDVINIDDDQIQWLILPCKSFPVKEVLMRVSHDDFLKQAVQLSEPCEQSSLRLLRTQNEKNEK